MKLRSISARLTRHKFPIYRQLESNDCGPTCIRMICSFYKKRYSLKTVKSACNTTRLGSTIHDVLNGARSLGLAGTAVQVSLPEIQRMPLPSILYWKQEHFVVLYKITEKNNDKLYHIADPSFGGIKIPESIFEESFTGVSDAGIAIILEPAGTFYEREDDKFSLWEEIKGIWELTKSTIYIHKAKFVFALILSVIAMAANWVMPIIFQKIIDEGIGFKNLNLIRLLAISQFVLFLGYIVSNNLSNILLSKIGYNLGISFLSNYLHKLIKLPVSFFDTKANSDLIQLVDDQDNLKSFLIYNLIRSLFAFSNLVVFSAILVYYNYWVFIAFLSFGILSSAWTSLFFKKRKILSYMKFSAASESKSNIYEMVMGMREIKINSAQDNKIEEVERIQNKINKFNLKDLYLNYYNTLGISTLNRLKDIIIIVFCAHLVVAGQMTLGVLMTVSYLLGQLSEPFNQLLEFCKDFQDAKLSFDRLSEIQKVADEDTDKKQPLPAEIVNGLSLINVSFKYAGSFSPYVLKNIHIHIPAGRVTAIVGASGSGKTTMLKLLLAFYYPQKGDILLDNIKMSGINSDEWRKKCGVVMQDGYMFSGTIMENIAIADDKPDFRKLKNAAEIACIDEFIKRLPMGYHTKIGNTGIDLSGGQKQRLLIARAVYKNPEFIFFDEATSFLDTTNEAKIMQNLKSFYQGKTVVIIAHRLSTVKDADNIIVLENGQVIEHGSHYQLTTKKGKYYTLIKNQLELGT